MYEDFFGLREKPFSLTPDSRYFYRSDSHANALELVQHAIRRREGLVVITGTSGIGKTTLCRTILDETDRKTLTSVVLNPYITEEDLLRLILQDFGVISREENRRALPGGVRTHELIETLQDFLVKLRPLGARALVVIDEAQKLHPRVLEQIQRLSGLAIGSETLLQIVLTGQLNLTASLRAPQLRQLDNRVLIRYRLRPLTAVETASYIRHRLVIAGDASATTFTAKALHCVHKATSGNPRLTNLVCDRALLNACSDRAAQVRPEAILKASNSLGLTPAGGAAAVVMGWVQQARVLRF
jgi:general secretion pathway protein A